MGASRPVDLAPKRLERIRHLLAAAVATRLVPGAVALVGRGGDALWQAAVGEAESAPFAPRPMRADTIFDLASLTKVVATLPLVLALIDEGAIAAADPVAHVLPEFTGPGKERVTVGQLLAHTGGLASGGRFYLDHAGRAAVVAAACALPLAHAPGSRAVYSDLGYILLGEIVERVLGSSLNRAARARVFDPLGMGDTGYRPAPALAARIAATEVDARTGAPKVGVVHDRNAEAMGGVAGHAGLFATAADLGRYLALWVGAGPDVLSAAVRRRALRSSAPPPARRGWGWVLVGDGMDVTGDLWPAGGASHTGFTGTSLAFDRASGVWAVLLTNRVHFGRDRDLRGLRARFHNLVAAAVLGEAAAGGV